MGTMGVCPAGASEQPVMPPGTFGGNLDTRQLVAGTTLFLPVQVDGALFSTGDAHGCQGDGEICVTGLESPMYAVMRFRLIKGKSIPSPQYRTAPGPLTPAVNYGAFYGTTGIGGDLYAGAQNATRAMIDHLTATYGLSPEDAYVALQPRRRPQDLRDRRRRRVRGERGAPGIDLPRAVDTVNSALREAGAALPAAPSLAPLARSVRGSLARSAVPGDRQLRAWYRG